MKRIMIAGTGSGTGKTTVTLGVMAALRRRGLRVQGFKCGPDYIDPTYHTAATGRPSRNLDSWMTSPEAVREIFCRAAADADISVIEGVMGLYDGRQPRSDEGSAAEISRILDCPVLLVVDCGGMARSAAAVVRGFQILDPRVRIAGVIANKVGSEGHYRIVRDAVLQECGVPVVGYLTKEPGMEIPERHLGLIPSIGRGDLQPLFDALAAQAMSGISLDKLMELADAPALRAEERLFAPGEPRREAVIAVARDAAFHFYYPENLELLEAYGARCVFFSPLRGQTVPEEADGLYLGGGFPEEYAAELARQETVKASIRASVAGGLPTLAECGGFMYLTEEIEDTSGCRHPMAGIIPGRVRMQTRLAALGYREVRGMAGNWLLGADSRARGHEFHYSVFHTDAELPPAYMTKGLRGEKAEGVLRGNLVAGYTHLHFASEPALVQRWLDLCLRLRNKRAALTTRDKSAGSQG